MCKLKDKLAVTLQPGGRWGEVSTENKNEPNYKITLIWMNVKSKLYSFILNSHLNPHKAEIIFPFASEENSIFKYFVVIIISRRASPIVGCVTSFNENPSDSPDSEEC